MPSEILSCFFATTFLVVIVQVMWHPITKFLSKTHGVKLISNYPKDTSFRPTFMLLKLFVQKHFEVIFVEVGISTGARCMTKVGIVIFKRKKLILYSSRSYIFCSSNVVNYVHSFLTITKGKIEQMYLLQLLFQKLQIQLTSAKLRRYVYRALIILRN